MTNYERVRSWMQSVDQETPESFQAMDSPTKRLRIDLIREEYKELMWELSAATPDYSKVAKEATDVLVVVYGLFSAMGVDADKAMAITCDNNDAKVSHRRVADNGKIVVPPEVKKQLKQQAEDAMSKLVSAQPEVAK